MYPNFHSTLTFILPYSPLTLTCGHTKVFNGIVEHVQLSISGAASEGCLDDPSLTLFTPCRDRDRNMGKDKIRGTPCRDRDRSRGRDKIRSRGSGRDKILEAGNRWEY